MNYLSIILTSFLLVFAFKSNGQSAEISFIHYSDTSDIGMEREIEFPIMNTGNNTIDSQRNHFTHAITGSAVFSGGMIDFHLNPRETDPYSKQAK